MIPVTTEQAFAGLLFENEPQIVGASHGWDVVVTLPVLIQPRRGEEPNSCGMSNRSSASVRAPRRGEVKRRGAVHAADADHRRYLVRPDAFREQGPSSRGPRNDTPEHPSSVRTTALVLFHVLDRPWWRAVRRSSKAELLWVGSD